MLGIKNGSNKLRVAFKKQCENEQCELNGVLRVIPLSWPMNESGSCLATQHQECSPNGFASREDNNTNTMKTSVDEPYK